MTSPTLPGRGPSRATSARCEPADRRQVAAVCLDRSVQHLVDGVVRLVEEFLDLRAHDRRRARPCLGAGANGRHAFGIENAARGCRIGDEHAGIAAAEKREQRRHLVEAAGDGDTRLDRGQAIERNAYGAGFERSVDGDAAFVDEAAGEDPDRAAGEKCCSDTCSKKPLA